MKQTKLFALVFAFLVLFFYQPSNATPIAQIDQITLGGAAYTGDIWTISISDPFSETFNYTAPSGIATGCNICNITVAWGQAISDHPTLGAFFTVQYDIWDGVSLNESGGALYDPVITLTANQAGVAFNAAVSVIDGFSGGNPLPVTVSIETIQEAVGVPAPVSIYLFLTGLVFVWANSFRPASFDCGSRA